MATTQRIENTQETVLRTRARGHLSLVEWNADSQATSVPARKLTDPVRRASVDRLYEGGFLLLMVASALAAIASFAHL